MDDLLRSPILFLQIETLCYIEIIPFKMCFGMVAVDVRTYNVIQPIYNLVISLSLTVTDKSNPLSTGRIIIHNVAHNVMLQANILQRISQHKRIVR